MQLKSEEQNPNNEKSLNILSEINEGYSRSRLQLSFFRDESMQLRGMSVLREESRNFCVNSLGFPDPDPDQDEAANSINFFSRGKFSSCWNPQMTSKSAFRDQVKSLDMNKKKGLKFLAWILNRLLRDRELNSTQIISECLEYVIIKEERGAGDQTHQRSREKELQNIKRRIYDAINVMVAVGLISRKKVSETAALFDEKIKPSFRLSRKSVEIEDKQGTLGKYRDEIEAASQRVRVKRHHLRQVQKSFSTLKLLVTRNARLSTKMQSNEKGDILEGNKIRFPFLMIGSKQGRVEIELSKSRHIMTTTHYEDDILLLTELQALDYLSLNIKNHPNTSGFEAHFGTKLGPKVKQEEKDAFEEQQVKIQ